MHGPIRGSKGARGGHLYRGPEFLCTALAPSGNCLFFLATLSYGLEREQVAYEILMHVHILSPLLILKLSLNFTTYM